jgi:hypothetical protein
MKLKHGDESILKGKKSKVIGIYDSMDETGGTTVVTTEFEDGEQLSFELGSEYCDEFIKGMVK